MKPPERPNRSALLTDGGTRLALVALYLAPMLAGAAGSVWVSVIVFAALVVLSGVARVTGPVPTPRWLVLHGAVAVAIAAGMFGLGASIRSAGLLPLAPMPLWASLSIGTVAALVLRRARIHRDGARFARTALADIAARPETATAIAHALDLFDDTAETAPGDAAAGLITRLHPEAALPVFSALAARWGDGSRWQVALCLWLAQPGVQRATLPGTEVARLLSLALASPEPALQSHALAAAEAWTRSRDFGKATPGLLTQVQEMLANRANPSDRFRHLRPGLARLERTLRRDG